MLLGVKKSVKGLTPTFLSELTFWELESQWTPESLERNRKGKNSLD